MKKTLAYLFLLAACSSDQQNTSDQMVPLFPAPKTVPLNTDEGYVLNTVTGDSIKPLINSFGDTIITGKPIPTIGKVINPDSVAEPKVVKAGTPKVVSTHTNVHKIPKELTVIAVSKDSLKTIPLGAGDASFVLVNSTGDTIPTGIPIPVKGKVVPSSQPKPIKALPLRSKDNAKNGLQYLDADQGMNSSQVLSMLEDQRGNLWFGTYGGVSRYDGKHFTHFTENEGLSNNRVHSILKDKRGNLWFGTNGGVSRYDPAEDGTGGTFTHFTVKEGLSNNSVRSILEDKSGNLWFGTLGGGVTKFDGDDFTHFTVKEGLSNNGIYSMLEDKNGNLWFGTHGGGVIRYDPTEDGTGGTFTHFTEKEGLSNN